MRVGKHPVVFSVNKTSNVRLALIARISRPLMLANTDAAGRESMNKTVNWFSSHGQMQPFIDLILVVRVVHKA